MKALIQRVTRGRVVVGDEVVGDIGRGYVVLLGVRAGDALESAKELAHKTVNLRVFPDATERMNQSIQDVGGEVLVISQFTLYANTRKGNRPSFVQAADPETAEALYDAYVMGLRTAMGATRVKTGRFRARMTVEIVNDGPVTVELNTDNI